MEMQTQAQVQDYYARSAENYARYWLTFIHSHRGDGTVRAFRDLHEHSLHPLE